MCKTPLLSKTEKVYIIPVLYLAPCHGEMARVEKLCILSNALSMSKECVALVRIHIDIIL